MTIKTSIPYGLIGRRTRSRHCDECPCQGPRAGQAGEHDGEPPAASREVPKKQPESRPFLRPRSRDEMHVKIAPLQQVEVQIHADQEVGPRRDDMTAALRRQRNSPASARRGRHGRLAARRPVARHLCIGCVLVLDCVAAIANDEAVEAGGRGVVQGKFFVGTRFHRRIVLFRCSACKRRLGHDGNRTGMEHKTPKARGLRHGATLLARGR